MARRPLFVLDRCAAVALREDHEGGSCDAISRLSCVSPLAVRRNPLYAARLVRVPKYDEVEIQDVTRPYDGLFFIARMDLATLIPS